MWNECERRECRHAGIVCVSVHVYASRCVWKKRLTLKVHLTDKDLKTMSAPSCSSSFVRLFLNLPTSSDRCRKTAPPPGTMPSSTAANVAFLASSMRSLRSSSSVSVAAPTCNIARNHSGVAEETEVQQHCRQDETWQQTTGVALTQRVQAGTHDCLLDGNNAHKQIPITACESGMH